MILRNGAFFAWQRPAGIVGSLLGFVQPTDQEYSPLIWWGLIEATSNCGFCPAGVCATALTTVIVIENATIAAIHFMHVLHRNTAQECDSRVGWWEVKSMPMIYVKGALIGFVCWVVSTVVYVVSLTYILLRRYPLPPGVEVGIDLSTVAHRPSYWLIAIGAFALGFYWQFRRG